MTVEMGQAHLTRYGKFCQVRIMIRDPKGRECQPLLWPQAVTKLVDKLHIAICSVVEGAELKQGEQVEVYIRPFGIGQGLSRNIVKLPVYYMCPFKASTLAHEMLHCACKRAKVDLTGYPIGEGIGDDPEHQWIAVTLPMVLRAYRRKHPLSYFLWFQEYGNVRR